MAKICLEPGEAPPLEEMLDKLFDALLKGDMTSFNSLVVIPGAPRRPNKAPPGPEPTRAPPDSPRMLPSGRPGIRCARGTVATRAGAGGAGSGTVFLQEEGHAAGPKRGPPESCTRAGGRLRTPGGFSRKKRLVEGFLSVLLGER